MDEQIEKYGALWPATEPELKIEMSCIRAGGHWLKEGKVCGLGKSQHFENMRRMIWPNLDGDDQGQRWHTLCRDTLCANKVTTLMGAGGCGKTHEPAWLFLCDYWCHPLETIVLVSSTDLRGLNLRVWGQMKELFGWGNELFPWLAGNLVDSKNCLATDDLDEDRARDLRRGIIAIPCVQNGRFVGLGKYVGIHQKRVRLIADEAQFMSGSFLSAFANLNQNPDFWAAILGNPLDPFDSLGRAAEPMDGWAAHLQPDKTSVWKTKFMNGACVNLIGTDSPNFDFSQEKSPRFRYLPSQSKIDEIKQSFGMDSMEYHSQCIGSMRTASMNNRVLTRELCTQFHTSDSVNWKGTQLTRIYGVDAAYGGDRCVSGYIEFGEDINGKTILRVHPPGIIPIKIAVKESPEEQISVRVKDDCEALGILPENMFHDSTGRGSLGTSLARVWSAQTNPVEFGGPATNRPVSLDHYIRDPKTGQRRLKLANEHYLNFVTELWYSIRFAVEAGQVRNLPEEVMEELCMRQWKLVNFRIQVEPKTGSAGKPGMKERTGRSPDLGDWLAICVEGARRRGFNISKLANPDYDGGDKFKWLKEIGRKSREMLAAKSLDYSA